MPILAESPVEDGAIITVANKVYHIPQRFYVTIDLAGLHFDSNEWEARR